MTKPNFAAMSKSELKAYLLKHRNDTEAFHALMDKITSEPNQTFYTVEEVEKLEELIEDRRRFQENS
ncbi:hypothetical protein NIES2109_40430 [Nostoc sp. HK-01]|uniref:Uncharacterized protein n=2 Tax=Nostocales TaxID=1161 RepID=A0A1Z4GBB2_9CYAN|nr:hypothetical protein [Nostoc cycadae]BAY14813.1 hypothetical protein NIES21_05970 [Anabaenopsis circularis NIES-21]BBD61216.1 hypothetical protein NIES2109_40430 [Nostoc sp. HK-01]GBE91735.1 hypothetical protein NCWK1_1462 [Nostoc cycadae WK-1]